MDKRSRKKEIERWASEKPKVVKARTDRGIDVDGLVQDSEVQYYTKALEQAAEVFRRPSQSLKLR